MLVSPVGIEKRNVVGSDQLASTARIVESLATMRMGSVIERRSESTEYSCCGDSVNKRPGNLEI